MKLQELTEAISTPKLYHATKLQYYKKQLDGDRVMAAMIHRFWKDGKRRERKQPGYDDHVWIKGLSLSRNLRFCLMWGILVFELDRAKLNSNYKLLPITWFTQDTPDPKGTHRRREAEEYLWVDTSNISGDGPEPLKYADEELYVKNWHKYCTHVYISAYYYHESMKEFLDNVEAYCKKYQIPLSVVDRTGKSVGSVEDLRRLTPAELKKVA